jgi:hypothetical protein
MRNAESPSGDRGVDQLATRERQAGPYGVGEMLVLPTKPGSSGVAGAASLAILYYYLRNKRVPGRLSGKMSWRTPHVALRVGV